LDFRSDLKLYRCMPYMSLKKLVGSPLNFTNINAIFKHLPQW